ncbi:MULTISPECIES: LysR family transcriptional regulator [unclassified Mesorhizobium]|uniref:LysR family transcriptional regulator n=1 Tax=unclassified Mesorhizobium TaxID=325217 RepID=UPI0011275712|nr:MULTISPECIES: LysR family transcriptional regulator [unclassified Mesorhizobium]MBZ9959499.1 LysR family transcriptional regulator [Mesorhizobium sp. BR1-1-14]TPK44046.1 LysR family transcriptional regulator [Mesorhizobium sp. B2-5-2]TPL20243.1 LysR family transcriptional regulator [Mesorhizobium sp. B2-4-9]TPL26349.1 LysR family transcriptional regulator [Mesorhizobium sp. B2-4-7]TPL37413.1 LysR family transcriptional regulator [Mesorhizobium sp. B2-4-5]
MTELLNLNRLVYFTTVMETGSFTTAADRLGVAKAVVSHQIGRLEQELCATLMRRTTRRVTPTEEGRLFYDRAMIILREAEAAYGEISHGAIEPKGMLRLTAPLDYGTKIVAPVMAAYLRTYPHMRVEAIFDDAVSNLVDEQIDLGIRVGWLADSSNQARRLGTIQQVVVANPSFAASLPPDVTPRQARSLAWVGNAQLRGVGQWLFSREGETVLTELNPVIMCDKSPAALACVLAGIGLGVFPDYSVGDDIAEGRLVPVFADWMLPAGGIHAVFPPARFRPAKVRAFVELLAAAEKKRSRLVETA